MDITSAAEGTDGAVVTLNGRLDLASAESLRETLNGLTRDQRRRIAVDLAQVDFVDSSGLGALISGMKAARLAGGNLVIANPGEQPRLVLELTTLDRVLTPHDSLPAAMASLGLDA